MIICDICKSEEAPPENKKFGLDMCNTCANKIYDSTLKLQSDYAEIQKQNPVTTDKILRIKK